MLRVGSVILFLLVIAAEGRWHPNIPISSCPSVCVCESIFCKTTRKGRVICGGTAASCSRSNLTSFPRGIVPNVTGVLINDNSLTTIDFNDFAHFKLLERLYVENNTISDITIATPFRKMTTASFRNNQILFLPQRSFILLRSLQKLILENNRITSVNGIRFPRKLTSLNLNHNRIRTIAGGSFRNLKQLQILMLSHNVIDYISKSAFKHAIMLEVLELSHNNLHVLVEDHFTQLPNCWYIELKSNRINEVHPNAFRMFGFRNDVRHQIRLEGNHLRFIEAEMLSLFLSRRKRYSFYFGGNPIFCDCNIQLLRDDVGPLLGDPHKMICDSPQESNHTTLAALDINNCCL